MRHALLLMVMAIVLPGCSVVEYARYAGGADHGTIHGHDVYLRQTQIVNGQPIQVAYVKIDDFVDERNQKIEVLRAYFLPKNSPEFVKVYEVPADRSVGFKTDVQARLRDMIEQERHGTPTIDEAVPQEEERPRPDPPSERSDKVDREELKKELTSIFGK